MPSQWLAVEAETDPLTRARQLQRSWERLLADGALGPELPPGATAGLRPTIVESWRRSLATGLDPTELQVPIEVDQSEARERWLEHPLGSLTHVLTEQLRKVAEESRSLVVVTDASGLLLYVDGDEWLKERGHEMNFVEGARFSEAVDGTNGIGTALAADHALQVFAFEHFNQRHHQWICSGAPVHDPVSGQILGLIDLSSLWKIAHPRSLELVTTAARTIEQCLLDARRDRDARLRRRYSDLMTRRTDLLVDLDGYVLDGGEPAHPTRLEVPKGGGEVVLGDGSVAVAEPLGRGEAYLLRQGASHHGTSAPVEGLERAGERARELATEQAALRQVATLVARGSSPDRLFAVVAEQVARVFDVPLVRLVRYEPDGSEVVGGFSEGDEEAFPLRSRWPLDSPGVIASVRQTGRPARVDDYANLPGEIAAVVRRAGIRSAVASPIVVAGRRWGAIVVLCPRREPLPADTEARLTDFTELVATAIANAESRLAIGRLADEQAALQRLAMLVASNQPPAAVFSAVAREVAQVFEVDLATVCSFERDAIVVLSSFGVPAFPAGSRWPLEVPSLPRTIQQTGGPARIDDLSNALGLDALARDAGVKAAVGAPIVVDGSVFGSINIAATEGRRFPADTETRLAAFTELVSTAISNAEARWELRRVASEQEALRRAATLVAAGASPQEVFAAITTSASDVFGVPFASLIRVGPAESATMVAGCAACRVYVGTTWTVPADDPGITRTVLKSRRPSRIEDHRGVRGPLGEAARALGIGSVVGAPVIIDGAIWGVLAVGAAHDGPPLPADAGDRLIGFTELVTTTLINAETREGLRRLAHTQASLRRIATLVAEGTTADELFSAVAREVSVVLGAPAVTVDRYGLEGGSPLSVVVASLDDAHFPVGSRWPFDGPGARASIYETGRSVRIEDFTGLESTAAAAARERGLRWVVGAPIVVDGSVWGSICAGTTGEEPIPDDAESRLADFTELVSTAIANSETQEKVRRLLDEQAALRRVATLVAAEVEPDELFSAVSDEVAQLFASDGAAIARFEPDGSGVVAVGVSEILHTVPVGARTDLDDSLASTTVYRTGRVARKEWRGEDVHAAGPIGDTLRELSFYSSVAAPINVAGSLWGAVITYSARMSLPAGTEERLEKFGELVATAIANAESRNDLAAAEARARALAEEQAALRRVATLVAGGVRPDELFVAVCNEVARLVDAEITTIGRFDREDPHDITVVGLSSDYRDIKMGTRAPQMDWLASSVVYRTGRTARKDVTAAEITDSNPVADSVRALGFFSTVSAPIVVEGELWGVVTASSSRASLAPDTEKRVESFGELVATALADAQSRAELAASEARKSAVLEWALECIITIDHEGKILEFNPAAEATFGYRREEVLGQEMAELIIPPSLREEHHRGLERYLETGEGRVLRKRVELKGLRSDGTEFPVELTVTPITAAGLPMFTAFVRDITDRKRGEQERARLLTRERAARADAEGASERAQDLASEQAALRRVATLVAQGATPNRVFDAVRDEVAQMFNLPRTVLMRYDPDGTATVLATSGDWLGPVGRRWPLEDDDSSVACVRRTGRAARVAYAAAPRGAIAEIASDAGVRHAVAAPIVVEGALWGVMSVASDDAEPLPADLERRLAQFTALLGTAIANAESRAELAASRSRLVATADATRRRVERDLHDGIQQWLVALALKARKAAALSVTGESGVDELSGLADDLVAVTDELREISRGIHPAILSDAGLDDALEALARRSAIRVDLDVSFRGRYDPTLEATVYYVVAESITNAVKHAQASIVGVQGGLRDGGMEFEIKDDGVGGADPRRCTGMIGLKDRVETLGGTISFASPAGAGTTIRVSLPASPPDEDDVALRGSDDAASAPASG